MLGALIAIFSASLTFVISYLPTGSDIPASAGDLIRNGVGFIKSLAMLIPVNIELGCIAAVIGWQVAKAAFRAVDWVYRRIIK